jgi:hypothetical protein
MGPLATSSTGSQSFYIPVILQGVRRKVSRRRKGAWWRWGPPHYAFFAIRPLIRIHPTVPDGVRMNSKGLPIKDPEVAYATSGP